jgi:predicted alpha-1,2-mannosidase
MGAMRLYTRHARLITIFVCILTVSILFSAGLAGNSYSKKSIGIDIMDYNRVDILNIVADNFVLEKPTLVSPVDGTHMTGSTPTFEWGNVPGADNQFLLVDNDADFSSPIDNILLGATDENWMKLAPGYSPENYYWKVVAIKGDSSQDSDNWTFTLRDPVDFVNTLIGVGSASGTSDDNQGFCYPGVGVPFGTTQWTPQGQAETGSDFVPYLGENSITGFRGSHFPSGSQMNDYASVTVDPQAGSLKTTADARAIPMVITNNSPDYFACTLKDNFDVRVEVTATMHSGFFRLTYLGSGNAHILIDAHGGGSTELHSSENEIWVKNVQHGHSDGTPENAKIVGYSVVRFNMPLLPSSGANGYLANADFSVDNGENILVKVGTSFIGYAQARANLDNEIPDWDFDRVRIDTRAEWNRELGKIEVEGENENQMIIFYTALYHSMLVPRVFSENGRYYSVFDGENHTSQGYQFYDDFSLWDTFRAENPLLALIEPARVADMAQSLVDMYEQGGWMPKWPNPGYSSVMIATHGDSVIADAYLKGIKNFDIENAYAALIKNATVPGPSFYEARAGIDYYKNLGYVPADISPVPGSNMGNNEGTSCTLEYAYDDWCIAQLAKALGKDNDYELLMERAYNYRNVFDSSVGFVRGRNSDGSWSSQFDPLARTTDFTEGNSWQYTWFVPHDIQGLIQLMGGRDKFNQKLDQLFENTDFNAGWQDYYNHANEPSQGIVYLYNWSGEPWKTQENVREVMEGQYWTPGNRPYSAPYGCNGLTGNEDCGQMSAWYIFSAMGFYPVCPAQLTYQIGSPIFDRITIHLDNSYYGGDFVMEARNVSRDNKYIQSATLNGEPLEKPWFMHSDLGGGHLVLEMGPEPNYNWGSAPEDAPPSMFTVSSLEPENGTPTGDTTPTFKWENCFVADNYEIWVDNDSDFGSPEILENTTDNTYTPSSSLAYDNYWWKVRAYVWGENKPFLNTWTFTVLEYHNWWDNNWTRRRPITVGAHLENYQVKVVIPSAIPESDYPSIRFLENETSGLLPYWIERDEGSYLNVAWIRRLENSDDIIWMYYGNPSATSAENGDNTFMFFDDFGGGNGGQGALDTSKWGASSTGVDVYQYVLRLEDYGNNDGDIEHGPEQGIQYLNVQRVIEFRVKNAQTWRGGLTFSGRGVFGEKKEYAEFFDAGGGNYKFFCDGEWSPAGLLQADKWWVGRVDMYSDNKFNARFYWGEDDGSYRQYKWNSGEKTNNWNPDADISNYCDKYRLEVWDGGGTSSYYYDWFIVRKWAATEPIATVGSEENVAIRGVSVSISPSSQIGDNGAVLTYTVTITNNGNVSDNYSLTVSDNASPSWSPTVSQTSIVVASSSSDNMTTLNVTIPNNAIPGTIDNLTVTATSQTDNTVSGLASCTAQMAISRGVSVSISPSSQIGDNGAVLTYTVAITNTGNVSDTYTLENTDNAAPSWAKSLSTTTVGPLSPSASDNTTTLSVTIPLNAIGGTIDNITVTANGTGDSASSSCTATVNITRTVSVSITPGSQIGDNGATLNYTITVNNNGNVSDNYALTPTDNAIPTWSPSVLPTSLVVAPFGGSENSTLSVTIPSGATVGTIDNITVTANGTGDNASSSCTAQVVAIWTGTATFNLENLYAVGLEKDLQINAGSKLVAIFYTYGGFYQDNTVLETFTLPVHIMENENVSRPGDNVIQRVDLVLIDNSGNVISTIASFVSSRTVLVARVGQINGQWPFANEATRTIYVSELGAINGLWPFSPETYP